MLPVDDPAVLVDASTADDAAVYRLDDDRALVVTADFFTPIVDDPYDFGRIAAANALSDIYAMGARPLLALNLVGFPRDLLGRGILEEILRGGGDVARAAGLAVLGGHSIDDAEPKYGLCVVGEVRPDRVVRNSTARPGDALVLTKPLGTGIIATAIKAGRAPEEVVEAAVASMTTLNRAAAEIMVRHGVHACTDVTGYGLLGHLREMAAASGVDARLDAGAVPILPGARELARAGHVPGGTKRNLEDLAGFVDWGPTDELTRLLLVDAQTSGGLLIAVPAEKVEGMVREMRAAGGTAGGGGGGETAGGTTGVGGGGGGGGDTAGGTAGGGGVGAVVIGGVEEGAGRIVVEGG
jgi:selenide, water dikinase